LAIGSTLSTMPLPPPYGVSSTLWCLSVVKRRGEMQVTCTTPAATALPSSPTLIAASTSSGNRVTTW
jgi:hypothetical protein